MSQNGKGVYHKITLQNPRIKFQLLEMEKIDLKNINQFKQNNNYKKTPPSQECSSRRRSMLKRKLSKYAQH